MQHVVKNRRDQQDTEGVEEIGSLRFEPVAVVRGGRRYACTPADW